MAFMADLSRCKDLAAQNDWVSDGPDAGSKGCVAAVKALTGLIMTPTALWRRGMKVKDNNILPGTAIATFPIMLGNGNSFRFKGHAAIFVGYTAGGFEVYHQWDGVPFHRKELRYKCSGYVSNDADAFYVIELQEVSSNEPALCSSGSFY